MVVYTGNMKLFSSLTVKKALPWILIIGGIIGLLCAAVIMYEKIELLKNPAYTAPCDLNPVISCGSVMKSHQASAFGFPNPFIGLAAFPVLITSGVVMLMGAKIKRWYALGLHTGAFLGVLFVHWLFYAAVYDINALCPWCMIVWAVTITTFVYMTVYNIQQGFITLPGKLAAFITKHHLDILLVWLLILFVLIMKHFWYYYGKHLGA